MKHSLTALLAFVAALGHAQTPSDLPLEQTKKNIKVLQGVPSSQLIPIMTVIANSIGVACTYCHETAWESDAKPTKEAGRRMLKMTRAMNDQHYGGKVIITCNTCHQGHVAVPDVPLVSDAGWNKPRPPSRVEHALLPAEELFARYRRALGPPEAIEKVKNRLSRGVASARSGRGDPRSAGFEIFQELPETVDLKIELPYPPQANREFGSQFFNQLKVRDRYSSAETIGVESIRGRDAYIVRATPKDGSRPELLYFEAASGLLLRRHRESPTIVGPLPEEYDFDDYRTVDGVMVPFFMQWSRADYQVTHLMGEVKQNVEKRP
jgi:photosynthetic reaction center cytochrome c subunit